MTIRVKSFLIINSNNIWKGRYDSIIMYLLLTGVQYIHTIWPQIEKSMVLNKINISVIDVVDPDLHV